MKIRYLIATADFSSIVFHLDDASAIVVEILCYELDADDLSVSIL
jgi:hypothetical protein